MLRALAALLVLAALAAAPSAALAQSAGDDQYSDPFQGEDAPAEQPQPEAPAEQPAAPPATAAEEAEGSVQAAQATSAPALPRPACRCSRQRLRASSCSARAPSSGAAADTARRGSVSVRGPTVAVSYSGLLGGGERLLLDMADGLPDPPLIACPAGPLADAARGRGLGVFELRPRSLALRNSAFDRVAAPARVAAQGSEVRALTASLRPGLLIAWGMRAGAAVHIACAGSPAPAAPSTQRPAARPAGGAHREAGGCRRGRGGGAVRVRRARPRSVQGARGAPACGAPGVDLERFFPAQPRRWRGRASEVLVLERSSRGSAPTSRWRWLRSPPRELPDLRVRLAGQPIGVEGHRLLERLRGRAAWPDLRGRVTIEGSVNEPERALRSAACLLHCADREPYGLVVAEALASGVPVVVPDSCGPAEIAEASCGRLYAPRDAAAAARALVEVLEDPAQTARLGASGRARAEQTLDLGDMQARYAELVERLASGPAERRTYPPRPAPPGRGLAVVTVLHNSERELGTLLGSLERRLPGAQVVVVDSGSSSEAGAALAREWRGGAAAVLALGENVGFGRGVNAGLALVDEPVTALLNPDVELPDASLAAVAREALRAPDRLLAPLVLRPDGTREDNAQREPGSPALLAHALVPGAALPALLAATIEPWRSPRPRRAGWAVGSAVVARTELLRRLGPFDERAFMYAEDLDLGLRAAEAGIETWFWPAARVVHGGAHSTLRAFGGEPFDLLARRRREVVRERRGDRRARADDLLQLLTIVDRLLIKRLLGRDAERERARLGALLRARREGPRS